MNYVEHFLILVSTLTGCVSIFAFASLVFILIGIMSSAIRLKICVVTAVSKKYKSIIKKKKNKHNKTGLLTKPKLTSVEVLIYKALTDSNIIQDLFVLKDDVPKESDCIKEEITNSNDK